jgi:P2-related tail formation protein
VKTAGACANAYTLTRTWTAKDDCGNEATATQIVTVIDDTKPVLSAVPKDVTVQCNAVPMPATLTATDNCDTDVPVSFKEVKTAGACANAYTLTRTWTAKDDCGNEATATQIVTVIDDTKPTFTKPADITIYADASCKYDASPSKTGDVTNEADNCSKGLQATYKDVVTQPSCGYVITRTWSLKDECGNMAADQVQTITVLDNIKPVITVTGHIPVLGCSPTQAQIDAAFGVAIATDNCDQNVNLTSILSNITITGCEYKQTKTWTATDDCGNQQTKATTVIWTIPPTVDCYSVFIDARTYNVASNSTTFRFRVCANNCPNAISYVAFIIKDGIRVLNPINGSNYNYPGDPNINYRVVTPVAKSKNGVKYETIGEGLKNGCDVFEFTLSGDQSNLSVTVEVKAGPKTSIVVVNPNCLCSQPINAALTKTANYRVIPELQVEELKVTASPNPYIDQVQFRIESPVSGQGVLEVYNLLGQKVQTVFQGHVFKGKTQTVNYNVPPSLRTTLIYQMRVGSYRTTGRLLNGK